MRAFGVTRKVDGEVVVLKIMAPNGAAAAKAADAAIARRKGR